MTQTTRLENELADALGLTQAVRTAAGDARTVAQSAKLRNRLDAVDHDLAELQEALNELVVASPGTREQLTGRSARLRDTERTAQRGRLDGADELDALQALAAEAAYALAQWTVVRRLARAEGAKPARKLVKWALPAAERHLDTALRGCDRAAKRLVERAAAA